MKRLDEDIAKFEEEQLSGMKLLMANPNGPVMTPYTDEPMVPMKGNLLEMRVILLDIVLNILAINIRHLIETYDCFSMFLDRDLFLAHIADMGRRRPVDYRETESPARNERETTPRSVQAVRSSSRRSRGSNPPLPPANLMDPLQE